MNAIPVLVNVARPLGEVDVLQFARRVRAAGLTGVGFTDSPQLFPDPLVETTRVLAADDTVMAGPCVHSLSLMHVARTTSALTTLGHHFPGRVLAVVGRGESSLVNEGLRPPALRSYVAQLNDLRARLPLDSGVTLLGAGSGPRTIAETARALGGVLVDVGTDAGAVSKAVAYVHEARPEALVFAFVRASVAFDSQLARRAGDGLLGSCARRIVNAPSWYGAGPDLLPGIEAVARSHDYRRHGTEGARGGTAGARAEQQDAADFVRDRFILTAPAQELTRRLADLVATGIDGLVLAGGLPGVVDHLEDLGAACVAATTMTKDGSL